MDQKAIFSAIQGRFRELNANAVQNTAVLLVLFLLLILLLLLYRRVQRGLLQREWKDEYNRLIRQFDLTINELDLLNRMAVYLDDRSRKNLLLTNRNTFHHSLKLLESHEGNIPRFSDSLTHKLFSEGTAELPEGFETLFGLGRPVRYISPEGDVFGGQIILRESDRIILGDVRPLRGGPRNPDIRGEGRIFIQDYRGLMSHGVVKKTVLSETSLQLDLGQERGRTGEFQLPDIFIYLPGDPVPLESSFYRVSEGMGIVENPGGRLKMDQSVKVALQRDSNNHYHVNALVRGLSLNRRYAKLKFGYLNGKFY